MFFDATGAIETATWSLESVEVDSWHSFLTTLTLMSRIAELSRVAACRRGLGVAGAEMTGKGLRPSNIMGEMDSDSPSKFRGVYTPIV
jgi:hypothetical protein